MNPVEFMVEYFNLEPYLTKENMMAAGQLLYYYTLIDSGGR
jgi:hypothetical protein